MTSATIATEPYYESNSRKWAGTCGDGAIGQGPGPEDAGSLETEVLRGT